MHRCVAGRGEDAARPDGKKSFMVHGPLDVKTKTPTVSHVRRRPEADPPSQMLFIARGHNARHAIAILSVCVHVPTNVFSLFFMGWSHKYVFLCFKRELKTAPASV